MVSLSMVYSWTVPATTETRAALTSNSQPNSTTKCQSFTSSLTEDTNQTQRSTLAPFTRLPRELECSPLRVSQPTSSSWWRCQSAKRFTLHPLIGFAVLLPCFANSASETLPVNHLSFAVPSSANSSQKEERMLSYVERKGTGKKKLLA